MTMSKVANLKSRLADGLGHNDILYWDTLASFLNGRITKAEFEDVTSPILIGPNLGMSASLYAHFPTNA
jgi:hypothetical protein